ncbi:hypothetical protein GCM10022280_08370 [Sphingomonas swuensis]|uniref:DUF3833 domain-containing protein n=1 Tax=Sphingomonas swuensis TaxID=977800 RepID=A0ABP7SK00_9SPHN
MTAKAVLPLAFVLAACAPPDLPAGTAPLDPVAFFTGESRGEGVLDPIVGKSVPVTVESRGSRTSAGGLSLVQRIAEGSKKPRIRTWVMQPRGPGRFTGTLTDATGPVEIESAGPRATVRYHTPSGLRIEQQLALQPDGRTILNRLEAFKFGVRVAVLNETIRK